MSAVYSFPLRNLDQHVGSIGLFNATPAELDQVDLELVQLLADLTASIVGAHRYQQVSGLAAGVQQRLADAAVLEQAKAAQRPARGTARPCPRVSAAIPPRQRRQPPRGSRAGNRRRPPTTANPADEITRGS